MADRRWRRHIGALFSIIAISVVSYLPAIDNFFISDDFGLFTVIEAAQRSPRWFLESTTEFFRLMSYIYFAACYYLFGLNSEPFYWAGIGLHALVSILLYWLVFQLTRSCLSAWVAGLFFAAYERHQEAVMWISAANETILALNCLVFLLLWRRAADSKSVAYLIAAHVMFVVALFSKEAAVVLLPLAVLQLLMSGYPWRAALRRTTVLILMLSGFGALWVAVSQRNFFLTQGHYALGWQFIPVYVRSLVRLVAQIAPLILAWLIARSYQSRRVVREPSTRTFLSVDIWWKRPAILFVALLVLAILPYSFLTYLNHIPSRNTYLPSLGLAGLVGVVFAALYRHMATPAAKRICIAFVCAVVSANVAYIWLKKEPQYRERAAPTRELIDTLNTQRPTQFPVNVCRFPLDPWTFTEAVTRFTPFDKTQVVLADSCDGETLAMMQWDDKTYKYVTNFGNVSLSLPQVGTPSR